MRRRLANLSLVFGLAGSLLAHGLIIVPAMIRVLAEPAGPRVRPARLFPAPSETEDRVRLGLDESTASTLTWIGHDEYLEHLARLGAVEQAAFAESPAAAPAPDTPPAPPAPPPVEPAQDAPVEPVAEAVTPPPPSDPSAETLVEMPTLAELLAQFAAPRDTTPAPEPLDPAPSPPVPPPAPAAPFAGTPSDRESDATSLTEVPLDDLRPGRPLAAAGLELKPRRPDFTTLMLLTASPRNPLVEISFPRSGRPLRARIIDSSSDGRIDDAILSSLYRWRAEGAPLAELTGEETIDVRIRIVLTGRRR